jgi:hypothetical protein
MTLHGILPFFTVPYKYAYIRSLGIGRPRNMMSIFHGFLLCPSLIFEVMCISADVRAYSPFQAAVIEMYTVRLCSKLIIANPAQHSSSKATSSLATHEKLHLS